jgi:hypothetical protein
VAHPQSNANNGTVAFFGLWIIEFSKAGVKSTGSPDDEIFLLSPGTSRIRHIKKWLKRGNRRNR